MSTFHELDGLFLVLVQFVHGLGLDFFDGVDLSCLLVDGLVDLGVLLARAQQLHSLKVALAEHNNNYY